MLGIVLGEALGEALGLLLGVTLGMLLGETLGTLLGLVLGELPNSFLSDQHHKHLNSHHNSAMAFDPTCPDIDHNSFLECDWKDFHGEVEEALPPNAPKERGKPVDLQLHVDLDHAGDQLMRRSTPRMPCCLDGKSTTFWAHDLSGTKN